MGYRTPTGHGSGDIKELTDDQAAAIESIQVDHYVEGGGDEAKLVKRVRVKFHPKLAALIQLGKHLGIPGFGDSKIEPPAAKEQPATLLAYEDPLREDSLRAMQRAVDGKKLLTAGKTKAD